MALDRRSFLAQLCSGVAGLASGSATPSRRPMSNAAEPRIRNPYEKLSENAQWLSGEVHTHVNKALTAPRLYDYGQDASAIYEAARSEKLDFVAMSVEVVETNGGVEQFGDASAKNRHGVIGIPAREIQNNLYSSGHYFDEPGADFLHVLTLGESNSGLSICAHPRFYEMAAGEKESWPGMKASLLSPGEGGRLEKLRATGIEVFNGHTLATLERQGRKELYTDYDEICWDELLMAGLLCWGFAANDAFVAPRGYKRFSPLGRVHVAAEQRDAISILDALKHGRFYSSTGVIIAPPRVQAARDGRVSIMVRAEENVTWSAKIHMPTAAEAVRLVTLHADDAPTATFEIDPGWAYIRVQCTSTINAWRRAWLQPIFNANLFGRRA